jgi:DNA-binding NtrC family response regulator
MYSSVHSVKRPLVGHSARLRHILRLAEKLGRGHWPVLLLGETGTGKELVARTIHETSAGRPLVTIDCSALVGPLAESELFGHVKGAFTGAVVNKVGLIEAANGGTAFFDEIGELPLEIQAKLLRVLQEKEYRPVGSLQVKRSSFRVIAATHRDLAAEVERGRFRQDLYFRLNVVTLRLAPLRERKEDIPVLINHFLARYGNRHQLSADALESLLRYDWPGNIRELENCIEHMVAVNSGPVLHSGDLPSALVNSNRAEMPAARRLAVAAGVNGHSLVTPSTPEAAHPVVTPVMPLVEMEKRAILQALEYTKGDRLAAAQMLGIGRTTLYRKIKEYNLDQ